MENIPVEILAEIEELKHQLFEARETIEAIRTGQVDALVVENNEGHQLYTLKSADQAYRVFIEKMNEGAITLNNEGIIIYSNTQFASMIGLSLSEVTGMRFEKFVIKPFKKTYRNLFLKSWSEDCKGELFLLADNKKIPVQLSLTALEFREGAALSIILTDLTAQKKTQQLLEDKNKELASINEALEASNHDLQQFASVASHDLQEPLRKIQMFSNLLKQKSGNTLSAESNKYLEKIFISAGRMKTLIVDVLSYSKLSAGDLPYEEVNVNTIVKDVLEDFELIMEEKQATVIVHELPVIQANYGQIRQVFQNLLSNALKFKKTEIPSRILISSKTISEKSFDSIEDINGSYCLISIMDNGIGFEEKYLTRIFALFERLHSKDNYEGTGIGLPIIKKIIEKHKGMVTAKSKPGEGSEFLLLLPVNQH